MAGSISLSLSQQFDTLGSPLNGGLLYTYAAGTTTPQSAYQDSGLTIPWPNPLTLENGRIPQLFFADGSIKIRLADANGVIQLAADGILVIGASSGGGGGSPVDATTILQTGQIVHWYGTGSQSGFVRCNGRTIGSAVSGATERANADTLALFTFLYQQDSGLPVSGGRGASAAADWAANKNIALPDLRGRSLAGLDDMGNSAAGRLTASWFGTNATVLGVANGGEKSNLSNINQIPQFTPQVSSITLTTPASSTNPGGSAAAALVNNSSPGSQIGLVGNVIMQAVGSASPASFTTVGPRLVTSIYVKL